MGQVGVDQNIGTLTLRWRDGIERGELSEIEGAQQVDTATLLTPDSLTVV